MYYSFGPMAELLKLKQNKTSAQQRLIAHAWKGYQTSMKDKINTMKQNNVTK